MKNLFHLIVIAFALTIAGCAGKSTSRVAITATESAVSTADAAISAWGDYVVAERRRITVLKQTDPGAALEAGHNLLTKEGKVSIAYYQYQEAAKAAILSGAASADTSGDVAARIAAAAAPLINLVSTLTTR